VSGPFHQDIASRIEYTLHLASARRVDVEKLCEEAMRFSVHAVCVNGSRVDLARSLVDETRVKVVALVGWPLGAADADAKRYETEVAADFGAHEIDYVINIGKLKDGDHGHVLREMRDVVEAADERPVKAVVETHLLTQEEKVTVCKLALDSGVKFISTATGYHTPAASLDDVRLLVENLGSEVGIKVVGNLKNAELIREFIEAGAGRIGVMRE